MRNALLHFHCKNEHAKALRCYVIRILSLWFHLVSTLRLSDAWFCYLVLSHTRELTHIQLIDLDYA